MSARTADGSPSPTSSLPVDPDVEVDDRPATRVRVRAALSSARRVLRERRDVLGVIAVGGALGALARWGIAEALPTAPAGFPWATFIANVSGAFVLGALMVLATEALRPSRYLRPFLAVGVLGGFTTFSTYMLDTRNLLVAGEPALAVLYLFGTLVVGLVAIWVSIALTRGCLAVLRQRSRRAGRGGRR